MQTRKQSLTEAITNTVIGFIISLISTFIIFPILSIDTTASTNVLVTLFFTVVSILRSYTIRRFFNSPKAEKVFLPSGGLYYLHCFNCEIEMPVYKKNDSFYCSNCKTPHVNVEDY